MRTGVAYAVSDMMMRKEVVIVRILKCELKYLHSGEAELISELDNRLIDLTEVLGYDRHMVSEICFKHGEEVLTRSLNPLSVNSSFISVRYGPELIEAAEMIYTKEINEFKLMSDPLDPPVVGCLCMLRPVVERIAPELTGC